MKIAFFGDSVTEGCFEIIRINGQLEVIRDYPNCFRTLVENKLRQSYPNKEFEFFNFGLSGRDTSGAIEVVPEIISKNVDLVIMCFGLNDFANQNVELFKSNLSSIYERFIAKNIKVVFMTHNMVNKYVNNEEPIELKEFASTCASLQNNGGVDLFVEAEKEIAAKYNVPVIDAHAKWKELESYGIDTSLLLCNYINHPTRKMHYLFANMICSFLEENKYVD